MIVSYEKKLNPLYCWKTSGLSSLPHLHKELELIYTESGGAVAYADKRAFEIGAGDLYIAFPNQIHYYEQSLPGKYYLVIVSADLIFGLGSIIAGNTPDCNVRHISPDDPVSEYFSRVVNASGEYSRTEQCGYLNLILGNVVPRMSLHSLALSENFALRSILDYCVRNFTSDITLDDLSLNLHLNKFYISHIINSQLNLSFNEYINSLRISVACDQLRETKKKIADISEDVGFGTIRTFNRVFRQHMNVTPAEYRSQSKDSDCL